MLFQGSLLQIFLSYFILVQLLKLITPLSSGRVQGIYIGSKIQISEERTKF